MADLNIENFYRDAAMVLDHLYAAFPIRTAVYVEDIIGPDQLDEYGMHSSRHLSCFYAMLWLEEEGFLRYNDLLRQDGIDQASLTHKGFSRLNRTTEPLYLQPGGDVIEMNTRQSRQLPQSVREDMMMLINQLRSALRSGSSIAIGKVIQHLLSLN